MLAALILVALTIVWPASRWSRSQQGLAPAPAGAILYFIGIGMGFMLAEMGMMQQLSIFLGQPIYSLVVVLAGLILAAGLGSLASDRMPMGSTLQSRVPALLSALVLVIYSVVVLPAIHGAVGGVLWQRIAVSLALVAALRFHHGFLLPRRNALGNRHRAAAKSPLDVGAEWRSLRAGHFHCHVHFHGKFDTGVRPHRRSLLCAGRNPAVGQRKRRTCSCGDGRRGETCIFAISQQPIPGRKDNLTLTPRPRIESQFVSPEVDLLAEKIWDYHHLNHRLEKSDAILVLGSHDLRVAERGAQLFLEHWAPLLIFSGGLGNLTRGVWDQPEADRFAEIAVRMGIPREKILIENRSTNTGENIRFTKDLLAKLRLNPQRLILVHKPYMERRAFATFRKVWPEKQGFVTSPQMSFEDYPNQEISKREVIGIMVGDLQRIRVYAAKGFQIPQKIPSDVWAAGQTLIQWGYSQHLVQE